MGKVVALSNHSAQETMHKFEDGRLVVYRRENSRFWQCRMLLPGAKRYIRESLKTTDVHQAIVDAKKRYNRTLIRQEEGLPVFRKKFLEASVAFKKEQKTLHKLGKQSDSMLKIITGSLDRYVVPFFGKMDLSDIKERHSKEFFNWRIQNSKNGKVPATRTLLLDYMVIKQVLDFSAHHGWIESSKVPKVELPKQHREEGGVRPGFTVEEFDRLKTWMDQWVKQATRNNNVFTREILRHMVLIITYSGMRTNDVLMFRWRDIEEKVIDGESHLCFYLRGKGIEPQWCVVQPEARKWVESWRKINTRTEPDDLVFSSSKGGQYYYAVPLKDMLKEVGLLHDVNGNERTMYSFRHTYAMMRLIDGVSVFDLAKNMRTSVEMIERHYGSHLTALQKAAEITGGKKKPNELQLKELPTNHTLTVGKDGKLSLTF